MWARAACSAMTHASPVFPAPQKNNGDQTSVSVARSYCYYFLAAFFLATFFFAAFFFAAIWVSFLVNCGIVCYGYFSAAPSIIQRTLRNLPHHSVEYHALHLLQPHEVHQRNHAWCRNSIPPYKNNAIPLLTFFSEDDWDCAIRTTLQYHVNITSTASRPRRENLQPIHQR